MAKIIDGKAVSAEVRAEIKAETEKFISESGITVGIIRIGWCHNKKSFQKVVAR